MPTEVIHVIGAGETYTTLTAWEAAQQRDLVSADEIAIAELKSEDFVEDLQVNGWTTDATRYVVIRAKSGSEYNSATDVGPKLYKNANFGMDIYESYTRLEHIRVGSVSYNYPFFVRGNNTIDFRQCTILSSGQISNSNNSGLYFRSCLIKIPSFNNNPIRFINTENCTIITSNTYGQVLRDGTAYNTLIYNASATTTYDNFFSVDAGDYNAQSVSNQSAPLGANSIDDVPSSDFNDYAGGDYTLSGVSADVYHAGSSTYAPAFDNNGVSFDSSTPSIGAFEFVSAGGTILFSRSRTGFRAGSRQST